MEKKKVIGNYTINLDREIGKGGYSIVYTAIDNKTGKTVAAKLLNKKSDKVKTKLVLKEKDIVENLNHDHIIKFYDFYEDDNYFYIFMKYVSKNLNVYIKEKKILNESLAYVIICQIIDAVIYLHNHGIAHLDIKPSNILIDENKLHIYITDFGLAEKVSAGSPYNIISAYRGTPKYAAPEMHLLKKESSKEGVDGYKADAWSIGLCLYMMMADKYPFEGNTRDSIVHSITTDKPIKFSELLTESSENILSRFLQKNPSLRESLPKILDYIKSKIYNIPNLQRYILLEKNINKTQKKINKCVKKSNLGIFENTHDIINFLIPPKYFLETNLFSNNKIPYDLHLLKSGDEISLDTLSNLKRKGLSIKKINGVSIFSYFDMNLYNLLSVYEKLALAGVLIIPVISSDNDSELKEYQKEFIETLRNFPEYKRDSINPDLDSKGNPITYVAGGFAALGNPGSFHNTLSRKLRMLGFQKLKKYIKMYADESFIEDKENVRLQALSDRMMYRLKGQKPVAESWHRDVMPQNKILKDDIFFGGWINLDSTDQYFSFIPGSHSLENPYHLKEGFATLDKEIIHKLEMEGIKSSEDNIKEILDFSKNLRYKINIPPGHMIIFPQYILHEVVANVSQHNMMRQFTGWRFTKSKTPIYEFEMFDRQQPIPLPGGMFPPMYSKNHIMFFKNKKFEIRPGVMYDILDWSEATFKDECLKVATGTNRKIVDRYMKSLEEMGLPKYKKYGSTEKKIYKGHKLFGDR